MTHTVPEPGGQRLDAYLAALLPELSRSRLQGLIKDGAILLNDSSAKPKSTLKSGDLISVTIPEEKPEALEAEALPLSVLHEDDELIVLDKAHGMVVHPAAGNRDGTLVNALLHHCAGQLAEAGGEGRPGIVHRLDKDTSGCIVAAKSDFAHRALVEQFSERQTAKLYLAVTQSPPKNDHETVFTNLGRHPVHRQRMAVVNPGSGKAAITDVHRLFTAPDGSSLVLCALHTGRTHQIRVHLSYLGHPLLGDPIYAKPARQAVKPGRLLLHAWRLGFTHPKTKKWSQHQAPLPPEFAPWTEPAMELLKKIESHPEARDYDFLNALEPIS